MSFLIYYVILLLGEFMNYLDKLDDKKINYFKILESEFPLWLVDYINTDAMLKQQYISMTCGTIYSDLFDTDYFFSSLDHSIGVALIVWHFTHDKKQTLSGLFHDIATPVFKHCIDFMNGDYLTQESTEDLTTKIISGSSEIMNLLERDNISIDDVDDYHKYSIADNDTPKLSADRLEYSLSNGSLTYNLLTMDDVERIYNDLSVQKNEDNIDELSFNTKKIAREFVKVTSKLSVIYRDDRTRYSMQFLADIIKRMSIERLISKDDLYNLKELEVIELIEKSKYKVLYEKWKKAKKVKSSNQKIFGVYSVCISAKVRYINPLVSGKRITDICKIASKMIDKNLSYDMSNYIYIDGIDFELYE